VIGTASTQEKAVVARAAGADLIVGYSEFVQAVREATDGRGAPVVYDGVGAATFEGSLSCLRPRGVLVLYGAASGAPPLLDIARLNSGGSLYVTRPSVVHYTATQEELRARAADVFSRVSAGQLSPVTGQRFPLNGARDAFTALETRRTTGKVLLVH
jgi:NADPH2:quinone reductase